MRNNKAKSRFSYLDKYVPDGNGGYVFRGGYYRFSGDAHARKMLFFRLLLLICFGVILSVVSGCLDAAGSTQNIFVVLPLTAEILSAFYTLWKTAALFAAGDSVKDYVFEAAQKQIPVGSFLFSFCAAAGFISDFLHVLINGTAGKDLATAFYLCFKLICMADGIIFFRMTEKLSYTAVDNENKAESTV